MKYVLDASVAVAALRQIEPRHTAALQRCMPLFAGVDEIIVPAVFDAEVAAALVRRGASAASVSRFLDTHLGSRHLVTVGARACRGMLRIIEKTRLRAADALYVWVAAREALPLITLDAELLERAPWVGVSASLP